METRAPGHLEISGFLGLQSAPRAAHFGSKMPQDSPRLPQVAPKTPQEAPRVPQEAAKRPQGGVKEANLAPQMPENH